MKAGCAPEEGGYSTLRCIHNTGETGGINHCHLGQHFAVQAHISFFEATDQTAVAHSIQASCSIDSRNPQTTEITLAPAPVAVSVAESLHHPLVGGPEQGSVAALEAASQAENFVATLTGDVASFDACHGT